ncbi:bicarbonate transport system permease protein CmpB [Methanobrevibacter cuticularis]|uniref:Bicarbonate transport system permease protein CmpB n=1 Tax=Methanobrevibacter cuticularis TaxID=47311 RepID=A0A166CS04_9EURY|nr:ABC transporter permease subunit [Methanobrevibacter cuticularis]KZX14801.1 bicarbonate transport system permease protein CmpB [Methanobrevibacter cuticularis]
MNKKIIKNLKREKETSSIKVFNYIKSYFIKFIAIIIFLVVWEILSIVGIFDSNFISSPSTIILAIWHLIFYGTLIVDTLYTLLRVLIGLFLALLIAIPLGFLLGGFFKEIEHSINPLFRILEQFNPLTLFHLLILVTLINELSTILVIYWAAQWPLLNNTVSGAKNVNPVHIKIAKSANFDKFDIFWKVQLRSALPNIFTGLRLGILFAFLIAFGVEMMGMTTGKGLGYFILLSQMNGEVSFIWAGIATMTLLSLTLTLLLTKIEKSLVKEKQSIN